MGKILGAVLSCACAFVVGLGCAGDAGGGGGAVAAGGAGLRAGVGSYDLELISEGFMVTPYDARGRKLGSARVEAVAGVFHVDYQGTGRAGARATLDLSTRLPENAAETVVAYRLACEGRDGSSRSLTVEVIWAHAGDERAEGVALPWGEVRRVTVDAPLLADQIPPGWGGVTPGPAGPHARLLAFESGVYESDRAVGRAWLAGLGLDASVQSAWNVLLALVHDAALGEALLRERWPAATGQDDQDGALAVRRVALRPEELAGCNDELVVEGLRVLRTVCGAASQPDPPRCLGDDDESGLLDFFLREDCLWEQLSCVRSADLIARCHALLDYEEAQALCRGRFPVLCPAGFSMVGDRELCRCACTAASCEAHCLQVAAGSGLPSSGGECVPANDLCHCPLDAVAYCAQTFGENNCQPGRYSERFAAYECTTAACGDGVVAYSCDLNPALAEPCDESAPATHYVCSAGEECRGCRCVPRSEAPEDPPPADLLGACLATDGEAVAQCFEYRGVLQGADPSALCPSPLVWRGGQTCPSGAVGRCTYDAGAQGPVGAVHHFYFLGDPDGPNTCEDFVEQVRQLCDEGGGRYAGGC